MITDTLIERIKELDNPTVAGIDTSFDYLPEDMKNGVKDFKAASEAVLNSTSGSSTISATSCPA